MMPLAGIRVLDLSRVLADPGGQGARPAHRDAGHGQRPHQGHGAMPWRQHGHDTTLRPHGGHRHARDVPIERINRDLRLMPIHKGSSEIQRIIISGNMLT